MYQKEICIGYYLLAILRRDHDWGRHQRQGAHITCEIQSRDICDLLTSTLLGPINSHLPHNKRYMAIRPMSRPEPRKAVFRSAEPELLGTLPVPFPPRYQLPMSVSFPSCVSIAAFPPTFEESDRKAPKYE